MSWSGGEASITLRVLIFCLLGAGSDFFLTVLKSGNITLVILRSTCIYHTYKLSKSRDTANLLTRFVIAAPAMGLGMDLVYWCQPMTIHVQPSLALERA